MYIVCEITDSELGCVNGGANRTVTPEEAVAVAGTALALSCSLPVFGHIAAARFLYNWYHGA